MFFKAKLRHSGLYHCRGEIASNYTIDTTRAFAYYLAVVPQTEVALIGSISDWIRYRNDVVHPIRDDIQLAMFGSESQNNQSKNPVDVDMFYSWTEWGQCVCGTFKYDTLQYRYGYCTVRIVELNGNVIVLPCAGEHLISAAYPQFAAAVANVSIFKEYQRCMGECVPGLCCAQNIFNKFFYAIL